MNETRRRLVDQLYAASHEHDQAQPDRLDRFRNVEPPTAELLGVLIRATGARRILELGTSNGYSTIWLADAAQDTGGASSASTSTRAAPSSRVGTCGARGSRSGSSCAPRTRRRRSPARRTPSGSSCSSTPSGRPIRATWPTSCGRSRRGGVLAVDNVRSHEHELVEFTELIEAEPALTQTVVPVGAGLRLAVLERTAR